MSSGYIDLQEVRQPDHNHELSPNAQQSNNEESNAIHESEVEQQLRHRIRELEGIVTSQNAELQEMEVKERNHNAVLEKLIRVQTEKVAIEENRETIFEDLEFQKVQAVRYTKEIDAYKDKLDDRYRQILKICNDAREKEEQMMLKVSYWKGKYENERKEKEENRRKNSSIKFRSGEAKLEQNNISCLVPLSKRRRRVFSQSPTVLPKCKNCMTVFDRLRPHEVQCRFHKSSPQPWKTWKKQAEVGGHNLDLVNANPHAYLYWPCCNHVGLKEPPGCLKLASHDLILPEEEK